MDSLDKKAFEMFSGRVVPKGATKKIKDSANVPTYVLEYLLGTYCTSDDEQEIEAGIEQVKRIRDLGNQLYLAVPNPVLKCWKPTEIANPPILPDDIPEKDEDIPDGRPAMDAIFDRYGGREEVSRLFKQRLSESGPRKKVGRNDPCPCGSGKKYKKCCGKNV